MARYTDGDVAVNVAFDPLPDPAQGSVSTAVLDVDGGATVAHVSPLVPSQVGVPVVVIGQ